jgi:hypothetical protein
MKKFLFAISIISIAGSVNAQSVQAPKSLTMQGSLPGSGTNIQQQNANNNSEIQGYSIAFLAYHYNDYCKLGINKNVIDTLAGELKKAEAANQIPTQVINDNVAESKRLFNEDPVKFCNDAKQIATVLQGMFFGANN